MAAPRAPRVYGADIDGVHEWIVAAPNQDAALEAFGVNQNLFAQGRAWPEKDPVAIEFARETPGVPLRRPRGGKGDWEPAGEDDSDAWAAALKAAPTAKAKPRPATKAPKAAPEPEPSARAATRKAAAPAAKPAPKPSRPDPRPLREAERALAKFEREAARTERALDQELDALKRRLQRERDALAKQRQVLQRAVDRARRDLDG